jgi:NAD dependent epimerase/dehydratase family enzyme
MNASEKCQPYAAVVLDGQKVLPKKTEALGYQFKYKAVEQAVAAIVK